MDNKYKFLLIATIFSCCFFSTAILTLAQGGSTTATIRGTIKDEQGAVIDGASINVKNVATNTCRETIANEDGSFLLVQLAPSNYILTVDKEGFSSRSVFIELGLGVNIVSDFTLKIGFNSTTIIEVTSDSLKQESKTESSSNISKEQIQNLPINRRNFLDFSLITPRAVKDRVPTQGVAATSGLSFNGQAARFNNITIDGLDNNETATGAVRSTFSQESIQEFQVVSDSFSAEFGRALGGVVNIVTKGGTNQYKGSIFLLNRNDAISARDAFAPFEPEFEQYQFGATLSGPIKKDKIFFFNSFERLSIKQSQFVTLRDETVKAARKQGFGLNNGPVAFALNNSSLLTRADIKLNKNDFLFIRYNFSGTYNGAFEPFGGLIGETNGGIQRLTDSNIAISNTYSNSQGSLINETRFLYGQRSQNILPIEDSPQIRLIAPEGLVQFGRSTLLPQPRKTPIYQIINNVSLARGRHQIKFGGDFYSADPDDKSTVPILAGGFALFLPLDFTALTGLANLPVFSGLEAFDPTIRTPQQLAFLEIASAQAPLFFPGFPQNLPLKDLPLPFAYAQGFGDTKVSVNQKQYSLFFQDDVKLKENLLVKIGLRYDLSRAKFVPKNNGNFSPRIAISYQPKSLKNLNLRGSYGVFFGAPLFGIAALVELTSVKQSVKIPIVPFPFSVIPYSLPNHRFAESNVLPKEIDFIPQLSTVFNYAPSVRNNYSQQVTVGFDYMLKNTTLVSVTYNYVRGLKISSPRNINPVVRTTNDLLANQLTGRVDPSKGDIFEVESAFDSYYNGLTVAVRQRFSKRVDFIAHYTFSKAIDNFLDIRFDLQETVDPLKPGNERGLSLQDVRSRFVFSGLFDLDYKNNPVLKNTKISAILNLESGRPYNLLAGQDLNLNGDNPPGDRPAFLGRNMGITPGFANLDLRLTKNFTFKESIRIETFFEAFNIFNRVNISEIDRVFTADKQGNFNLPPKQGSRFAVTPDRFRNAFTPRQFQFGLRINF